MQNRFLCLLAAVAALSTLPACAAPRADDALPVAAAAPTVQTAQGALPAAAARAAVDEVAAAAGRDSSLRRHAALEENITGQPLTAGNRIALHADGPSTYAAMFGAIRAARDHVNLEVYIFEADNAGAKLADLLLRKQRAGVQVNIIYDSVGSLQTPAGFFRTLIDAGAQVLEFNPVNPLKLRKRWRLNRRDHRKILVVDGKVAFTGGVNISDVYSKSASSRAGSSSGSGGGAPKDSGETPDKETQKAAPWRDTHIEIHGPAVAELQRLFLDTWTRQKGPPLPAKNYFPKLAPAGDDLIRIIASTPERPAREIYRSFLAAVRSAERSIHLTNAYFVPGREMVNALKDAARRGVDVKLILPSYSDSGLVFHAGRKYYTTLLRAGVQIYERQNAMLHAKTAVIDGAWSSVGSANMDLRSFLHNDEVNAHILSADFADRLEVLFQQDLAASRRVELETWRKRPAMLRVREWFGWLIQYWL